MKTIVISDDRIWPHHLALSYKYWFVIRKGWELRQRGSKTLLTSRKMKVPGRTTLGNLKCNCLSGFC